MSELVTVVDDRNRVVGSAPRSRVYREGLIHRCSYVIVRRSDGRMLVQRRSERKPVFPGFLDPTTGGVLRVGESYRQNAIRELEEELGIVGARPRRLFDLYLEFGPYRVWGRAFEVAWDGPVQPRDGEVVSWELLTPGAVRSLLSRSDVIPDGAQVARRYLEERGEEA